MGTRLSEDEVQRALDFCVHLFSPTTPEQHDAARRKLLASHYMLEEGDETEDALLDSDHQVHYERDRRVTVEHESHGSTIDRLFDVKAPIVDPSALARLLRSKLSLFRRNSSASIASVSTNASSASTVSLSASASISTPLTPSSPISDVFNSATDVNFSADGGEDGEGGDEEVRMVLEKVNARRVIHAEHGEGLNSLEQEAVGGLVMRLERGRLGLVCISGGGDE